MLNNIFKILKEEIHNSYNKVFLCIGTSRCIGDSLGPRVGEILSKKIESDNICVFGNIEQNVNYSNINIILEKIYKEINNPYLIIIDSALSNKKYIGKIIVNKKNMIIGSALDKQDYKLGSISIKGIVGENKNNRICNFNTLNDISEDLIQKLSENISNQIIKVLQV